MDLKELEEFYKGKKVLVTGHTGFKGSWMCMILKRLGADVYGYALAPEHEDDLFGILNLYKDVNHFEDDIRDFNALERVYTEVCPDVVFHLAAQPLVRRSYSEPYLTYETNVMGTLNLLECMRKHPGVVSFVNVTTDKVYDNPEQPDHAFTEDEKLDGYDPYSNSKSCSELITHSYVRSFFGGADAPAVSTLRAGNVIGGGDYAADRIVPDCVRAVTAGEPIIIRNPYATRPFQHVLEPLCAYLMIAMKQAADHTLAGAYNIGPELKDCVNAGTLADLFIECWGDGARRVDRIDPGAPHEAGFLKLDCTRVGDVFGWRPRWHIEETVSRTADWYKARHLGEDMRAFTEMQIEDYLIP